MTRLKSLLSLLAFALALGALAPVGYAAAATDVPGSKITDWDGTWRMAPQNNVYGDDPELFKAEAIIRFTGTELYVLKSEHQAFQRPKSAKCPDPIRPGTLVAQYSGISTHYESWYGSSRPGQFSDLLFKVRRACSAVFDQVHWAFHWNQFEKYPDGFTPMNICHQTGGAHDEKEASEFLRQKGLNQNNKYAASFIKDPCRARLTTPVTVTGQVVRSGTTTRWGDGERYICRTAEVGFTPKLELLPKEWSLTVGEVKMPMEFCFGKGHAFGRSGATVRPLAVHAPSSDQKFVTAEIVPGTAKGNWVRAYRHPKFEPENDWYQQVDVKISPTPGSFLHVLKMPPMTVQVHHHAHGDGSFFFAVLQGGK